MANGPSGVIRKGNAGYRLLKTYIVATPWSNGSLIEETHHDQKDRTVAVSASASCLRFS